MNRHIYFLLLLLGFGFSRPLLATDRTWTGATSSDWNIASNWSPSGVPGSVDIVTIVDVTNDPIIPSGTNTTILFLYVSGNLTISSGAILTVSGSSDLPTCGAISGVLTNNGTLNIGQANIRIGGIQFDGGTLTNTGSVHFILPGGYLIYPGTPGSGTVVNTSTGTLDMNGGFFHHLDRGTLTLSNSGIIQAGEIVLSTGSSVMNSACGKILLSETFSNEGCTTSNSGLMQINGALSISGGTFTNSGILSYNGLSGSITKNNGSVIVNNNPTSNSIFTYTGTFTGAINGIYTNSSATTSAGTFTAPNTFTPSGLPAGSQTLYAKITPSGGACTYIVPFTYVMASPPNFTTSPTTKTVCSGAGTTFTVAASDANSFQWQVNTGGGFSNLTNSSPYSGATTTTLTISDVTGLNGYLYRCVATGDGGTTNSTAATLTVSPAPSATISYEGSPFCADGAVENVTLAGTVGGSFSALPSGLVLDANTGQINPVGSTAHTYTVTYRIAASNGCSQFTTTASVVVSSSLTVSNPATNTALQGATVNVSFGATGGTAPRSFSIASGSLPSGLVLATTGVLSGTPTQSGSFPITVRVTDANGCSGVGSTYILQVSATATVTTTVPNSILETSATLGGNVTADGGSSVTERGVVYITGNGTPTTSDTKVTMGSGTGNYSQTVSNLVSGTTYSVRAYAINGVGTSYGAVQSFTTTSAPPAPVVLTPTNGSQLSNNRPTYSGTATPVSSVTVFVDDSYAGDITADASGNWSFTPSVSLPDGTHRVFARAMLNSLTSPNSNTNTFSIDTTPPAAPVITGPANGTITSDNTPTYAGTAEPSSTVTVRVNGSSIGTAPADASGNWSLTPTVPLTDGLYTVRATATDQVGNTGPASSTITFTIDTTSPTVSITSTAPNPTNTSPIPLTITFSESATGFLAGDITVRTVP